MPTSADPPCSAAAIWVAGTLTVVMSERCSPADSRPSSRADSSSGSLLIGDTLTLEVSPRSDRADAGSRNQGVRAPRTRPAGHRGDRLSRGLGEDQRGALDEAHVEPAAFEVLEHRRTADELRVLHLVREVPILAAERQDRREVLQLLAYSQYRPRRNRCTGNGPPRRGRDPWALEAGSQECSSPDEGQLRGHSDAGMSHFLVVY